MKFTKMHGIGNDFVMIDCIRESVPSGDLPLLSRRVCSPHFGVGADGLILVEVGESAPYRMRMFNPDGSESEMCGNGIRCFGEFLRSQGIEAAGEYDVETGAGVLHLSLNAMGQISVDMGAARLTRGEIGMVGAPDQPFLDEPVEAYYGTAVSMGNPHLVIFVPNANEVDLRREGRRLEHSALFPKRVNVHFAQVLEDGTMIQRTWERGAGQTLACGTGACAVVVAGFLTGRSERFATVHLPGGDLQISYREDGHVLMTGSAQTVFEGEFAA